MKRDVAINTLKLKGAISIEKSNYTVKITKNSRKKRNLTKSKLKNIAKKEKELFRKNNKWKEGQIMTLEKLIKEQVARVKNSLADKSKDAEQLKPGVEELKEYNDAISAKNPSRAQKSLLEKHSDYTNMLEIVEKLEEEAKSYRAIPTTVGVDSGKAQTKYAYTLSLEGNYILNLFDSRVERFSDCPHDMGSKFFVSDGYGTKGRIYSTNAARDIMEITKKTASGVDPVGNTKAHEYHHTLMLLALYEIAKETGKRVFNVGVGVSIDSYKVDQGAQVYLAMVQEKLPEELRIKAEEAALQDKAAADRIYQDYAEELKRKAIPKAYTLRKTKEDPITIIINHVQVFPETFTGATKCEIEAEDMVSANCTDIGGHNRAHLFIDNCKAQFNTVLPNRKGMTYIVKQIKNWFTTNDVNNTLDEATIKLYLSQRETMTPEIAASMKQAVFNIVDEILTEIESSQGYIPGVTSLMFIGGGSQSLEHYIREFLTTKANIPENKIFFNKDGIYSNVCGIYDAMENYLDTIEFSGDWA